MEKYFGARETKCKWNAQALKKTLHNTGWLQNYQVPNVHHFTWDSKKVGMSKGFLDPSLHFRGMTVIGTSHWGTTWGREKSSDATLFRADAPVLRGTSNNSEEQKRGCMSSNSKQSWVGWLGWVVQGSLYYSGGGKLKYFLIFTPSWGRFLVWLIFFKGVETTNQV